MLNNPPGSHLPSSTRSRQPGPRLGRVPHPARASFPSARRAAGTAPEDSGAQATVSSGHAPGGGVSAPGAHGVASTCQLRVFSHPLFPSFQSGLGLTSHRSCCEDRESPRKPRTQPCPALPTSTLPSGHPGRAPLAPGLLPSVSGPPCRLLPLFLWAPSAGNSWVPELGLLTCQLHPGPPVPVSQLQMPSERPGLTSLA